jgi:uncharacterized protein YcnI
MFLRRLALLLLAVALTAPASADAHISLHPNTIPSGAFATVDVRVPGERPGAHVTRIDMLLPPGFSDVGYQDVPGWSVRVIEAGARVSQIVWTWSGPLGRLENGRFLDFPLSLAMPAHMAGRALEFRTLQTYSDGQLVRWIEPSLDSEHPSPRINLTAPGGVIEDVAGAEAGPSAAQTPLAHTAPRSSGDTLGLVALILGALGVLVGGCSILLQRRALRASDMPSRGIQSGRQGGL